MLICTFDFLYTDRFIRMEHRNQKEPPPQIPSKHCRKGKVEKAKKAIFNGFDKMLEEGIIEKVEKAKIEGGIRCTLIYEEANTVHFTNRINKVMNKAFPSIIQYDILLRDVYHLSASQVLAKLDSIDSIEKELEQHFANLPTLFEGEIGGVPYVYHISTGVFLPFNLEFFKRIAPEEKQPFLNKMNALAPPTSEQIQAFKNIQLDHPIFQEKDWILIACKGFLLRTLAVEDISPLLLLDYAMHTYKDECHIYRIFDSNEEERKKARCLLKDATKEYFSKEQRRAFVQRLRELPPEKCFLFTTPLKNHTRTTQELLEKVDQNQECSITEVIYNQVNHSLCIVGEETEELKLVTAPPQVLKALFKAKYGEQAANPDPVVGPSLPAEFEDPKQRIVLLPCRFFSYPEVADGYAAPPLSFYHHDAAYHLDLESSIGSHRQLWIDIAKYFLDTCNKFEIYNLILDKELPAYHSRFSPIIAEQFQLISHANKFWLSILLLKIRMTQEPSKFTPDDLERFFPTLLDYLRLHLADCREKYQVDFDSLNNFVQHLPIQEDPQDLETQEGIKELNQMKTDLQAVLSLKNA